MNPSWYGVPAEIWPALDYIMDAVNKPLDIRTDGSILLHQGATGEVTLAVPQEDEILAVIIGGSNPYSWRRAYTLPSGEIDIMTVLQGGALAGVVEPNIKPTPGDATVADQFGAYERNNNANVLPGTIVVLTKRYNNPNPSQNDASLNQNLEYSFDFRDGPTAAQITTQGAPTCSLTNTITSSATSFSVTQTAGQDFPSRPEFLIKIDDEIMGVSTGFSTTPPATSTITVTRAMFGTTANSHTAGATITLVGSYAWAEVQAPTTGSDTWDTRPSGLEGDFLAEPAGERNQNPFVPDETFVLLWRKSIDGDGESTLVFDVASTDTTIFVQSTTSFPITLPFYIRVQGEYMRVTAVTSTGGSTGALTVDRGMYISQATQHEAQLTVNEAVCEWVFDYCCEPGQGGGKDSPVWVYWYDTTTVTATDYVVPGKSNKLVYSGSGSATYSGFDSARWKTGDVFTVRNQSTDANGVVTITHNAGTSGNQVDTGTGRDIKLAVGAEVTMEKADPSKTGPGGTPSAKGWEIVTTWPISNVVTGTTTSPGSPTLPVEELQFDSTTGPFVESRPTPGVSKVGVSFGAASDIKTLVPGLTASPGTSKLVPHADHQHPYVLGASRGGTIPFTGGTSVNDFAPSGGTLFPARQILEFASSAPNGTMQITGFDSSLFQTGQFLLVRNFDTLYPLVITNQDTNSALGNRVQTVDGTSIVLYPRWSVLLFLDIDTLGNPEWKMAFVSTAPFAGTFGDQSPFDITDGALHNTACFITLPVTGTYLLDFAVEARCYPTTTPPGVSVNLSITGQISYGGNNTGIIGTIIQECPAYLTYRSDTNTPTTATFGSTGGLPHLLQVIGSTNIVVQIGATSGSSPPTGAKYQYLGARLRYFKLEGGA